MDILEEKDFLGKTLFKYKKDLQKLYGRVRIHKQIGGLNKCIKVIENEEEFE